MDSFAFVGGPDNSCSDAVPHSSVGCCVQAAGRGFRAHSGAAPDIRRHGGGSEDVALSDLRRDDQSRPRGAWPRLLCREILPGVPWLLWRDDRDSQIPGTPGCGRLSLRVLPAFLWVRSGVREPSSLVHEWDER